MLGKRSKATASKEALMADVVSPASSAGNFKKTASFLFSSPRLFTAFASKALSETDQLMSPTSILDSKQFSAFKNPFWSESHTPKSQASNSDSKRHCYEIDSRGVGLAIVDSLIDEKTDPNLSKPDSRMVLFGSQLKIQIPHLASFSVESPKSPVEFGIKTRNSQLCILSPPLDGKNSFRSPKSSPKTPKSPRIFTGCPPAGEMKLSEDYTCIIARGPFPKTTHIFDNCIIESCLGDVGYPAAVNGFSANHSLSFPSENFLSFCYTCKKSLAQGEDIYMYRGEKAFCSRECRYQEMMLEERSLNV
ncbi:hypothetical protein Nepgr_021841 [Nepenthes gracilis]|uniref:FLZ-type domain-containing protein n=1 Tax=Nepenthes gracilis TaxID=150966 RepID=A0AAD3SY62_NEPGR|nr:hypothetical protein Nepgr_021841 [Nepenthes gracilis]